MTAIVSRWEWRTFGDSFGPAEAVLATMEPYLVVESDETYLVSAAGTDVIKIRDGLMDVKALQGIDEYGLEQWTPVLKVDFPLTAEQLDAVLASFAVPPVDVAPAAGASLADFLAQVVDPNPALHAIGVHKRRARHLVDGCHVELTDVRTDRVSTRTIAVESEDPELVKATLSRLRLAARPNLNFGRALRILEGFGAERFAVVDVGTNSVKFHVGDRDADGGWLTVVDRAVVTRLGEGLQRSGTLGVEAMDRTREAIAGMAEEARSLRVGAIVAVGTAGLRSAANSEAFVSDVEAETGIRIEVISGDDEARLAYRAATADLRDRGPRVVLDSGGGSSQFTFGVGDAVDERFSVDVGAVRVTEQHGLDGAVRPEALEAALASIASDLDRLDGRARPETLVAMGGTVTNLAAVKHALTEYDPDVVHGTELRREELDRQIELFRSRSADERRSVPGLQPARAEVILAGACIVRTVLDKLDRDSLTVCDRGLRYGVLAERFGLAP